MDQMRWTLENKGEEKGGGRVHNEAIEIQEHRGNLRNLKISMPMHLPTMQLNQSSSVDSQFVGLFAKES